MDDTRAVMTVAEVAALLRISKAYAYELIARNELPAVHLGRRILIPARAIEALLESWTTDRPPVVKEQSPVLSPLPPLGVSPVPRQAAERTAPRQRSQPRGEPSHRRRA